MTGTCFKRLENMAAAEFISEKCELEKPPSSFKSAVWDHFGFPVLYRDGLRTVNKEETACRHCFTRVKYTSSTTNMSTHLRRHHSDIDIGGSKVPSSIQGTQSHVVDFTKPLPGSQPNLHDVIKSKLPAASSRAGAITNSIGVFIALDMRPYSVVENVGFRRLVNTLEPRYQIPSRTHFTNTVMPKLYENTKREVLKRIEGASSVAITTDGWTSRATESYVTITAHFVSEEWQMENPVLQTRPLHESHTGTNLANVLTSALTEWKIDRFGNVAISTDNASNIVSAVKQSPSLNPHIRCFAHTVNLASQRAMQVSQMARILGRVRRVVSFFHRSSHAASVLRTKQLLLELPCHTLIQDVSTRWNSSYDMLERYLEQQAAIFATLTVKDVRKNVDSLVTLSDEDVGCVEDATRVLKPLKTITTIMCSEKTPTVSLILPLKELILKAMAVVESDSVLIKSVKAAITKDLKDRYTDPDVNQFLQEATALDPRFRSLPYHDETGRLQVFTGLTVKAVACASKLKTEVRVKVEPDEALHAEPDSPPLPALPSVSDTDREGKSESGPESHEPDEPCEKKIKTAMEEIFGEQSILEYVYTPIELIPKVFNRD
ncbi:E3 SUMO-protein ligase ZBED1-like [Haliotis cracherodii]|uniref:E3 SUMO-protein ligase ZBED1-like n=1 Tax=Haliotis cracherodii TaxID=6455 RepID=UPI0039EB21C8